MPAAGLRVDLAKLDEGLALLEESAAEEAAWVRSIEQKKAKVNRTCLDDGLDVAHSVGNVASASLRRIPWSHIRRFLVDWARIICACPYATLYSAPASTPFALTPHRAPQWRASPVRVWAPHGLGSMC